MNILRQATGLQVRMASEGERQYFAGILRVVDNTVSIHADFAPHVCHQIIVLVPFLLEESHWRV